MGIDRKARGRLTQSAVASLWHNKPLQDSAVAPICESQRDSNQLAQGCEERATLGHRQKESINRNAVASSPVHDATLSGLCSFDLPTQRRPTASSNAGLIDEIPLGFCGLLWNAAL